MFMQKALEHKYSYVELFTIQNLCKRFLKVSTAFNGCTIHQLIYIISITLIYLIYNVCVYHYTFHSNYIQYCI